MVEAVGFGDVQLVQHDADGAVGRGVVEELFFVLFQFLVVEVAAQGVAYLGELSGKEGVGIEGAAGIGDISAFVVFAVEKHTVVVFDVDVVLLAAVVEAEVLQRVVDFPLIPGVVGAGGFGMAGGLVAEAVEIAGAVDAELAG